MKSADSVTVTTLIAVDAATAFDVFTEDVDRWWRRGRRYRPSIFEGGTMRFEPHVGGRLLEVYEEARGKFFELGRVLVWEPGARLVFEWRARNFEPGQTTKVEVRFAPEGKGTRVTLEHRGWDALPADHPVRHGLEGGAFTSLIGLLWADLLVALRAHAKHLPRG